MFTGLSYYLTKPNQEEIEHRRRLIGELTSINNSSATSVIGSVKPINDTLTRENTTVNGNINEDERDQEFIELYNNNKKNRPINSTNKLSVVNSNSDFRSGGSVNAADTVLSSSSEDLESADEPNEEGSDECDSETSVNNCDVKMESVCQQKQKTLSHREGRLLRRLQRSSSSLVKPKSDNNIPIHSTVASANSKCEVHGNDNDPEPKIESDCGDKQGRDNGKSIESEEHDQQQEAITVKMEVDENDDCCRVHVEQILGRKRHFEDTISGEHNITTSTPMQVGSIQNTFEEQVITAMDVATGNVSEPPLQKLKVYDSDTPLVDIKNSNLSLLATTAASCEYQRSPQ